MSANYPIDLTMKPDVTAFFDEATNTVSYIVRDPGSDACAVIDSVLDFDLDGLTNEEEFEAGTSIFLNDTDGGDDVIALQSVSQADHHPHMPS